MSQESGHARFFAPSPSDVNIRDPNKWSKISYTREFLLSLAKADTVKLPREVHLSISCVFEDASGLLSPPFCAPDSRCHKIVPQNSSLKVLDNVNHLLHRSNEPYQPPCRYKALPPPRRDSNDLLNSETYGSSECTNQERWRKGCNINFPIINMSSQFGSALYELIRKKQLNIFKELQSINSRLHEEKSYADTVRLPKEDKLHSSKYTDSDESSKVFLMSPATRNWNTLQSTSNAITKQLDASRKPSLIQGAVRGVALQPSILPETTKNCSAQHQPVQDLISNETVNLWQKSVNHIDTSWHLLSMLDKGMHLMESEAYSNFNVGHPEGTPHVMGSLKKSRSRSFLSQENCGNIKKNHCEVVYEKGIMELQLSNTSVCVHGSPGRIAKSDLSEAYVSPPPVEDEKQFVSMVDKCESTTMHCEGILSLQGVKQAISVSMKQNPSSPGFQIQQELELNSFSSSLDGKSNSSSELCLPDEDSLITFDEPFVLPDVENSAVVDNSLSSPKRNPIKAEVFSPSSPRDMVEKLVESILNDESSPAPHLDDPKVHHGSGLEGFCHSLHAQQSYTQFCYNQLILGRDQQAHNSFQRNSIDSATYSLVTSRSFPSNTISQPFPLSHDELRWFDHGVSQSMFQQMTNPGKLHLCSLCVPQSGVTPHLPTLQMASCTQKLNPMQGCTLGYQEPSCGGFIRPNPDSHGDCNISQAVIDSLFDMELRARHWHPYVGGF